MKGIGTKVVVGGALLVAASLPATAQQWGASGAASPATGRGVAPGARASGLVVRSGGHATTPGFARPLGGHNLRLRFGHRFRRHHFHRVRGKRGLRFRPGFGRKHFLHLPFFGPHLFPVASSLVLADNEPSLRNDPVRPSEVTLLALKDGRVYAVTEYWLEGDQIFYVTRAGREDSFAIEELDWELTVKLNAERGIGLVLRPVTKLHAPREPIARSGSRHIRVPVTVAQD